ncbi:probable G-protein coupled receptor 34 [Melozone crissalis]|uniref:probable G-protein coupled receptor 34 n=1 Tax=Melozone crissalis TaxID=40204 RepID=UPI0023DB6C53|nr:probable G-protein coupled receptor 34 [Melozone crissalis]
MMDATSAALPTIGPHKEEFWSNQTNLTINASESHNHASCSLDDNNSLSLALIVFYSIIFVVGLVGNIVALFAFLGIHQKRNSIQVYLLNVAVADLLLIFCLPFRILYHATNRWIFGRAFCKVVGTLFYMNMYISIVLLGLISLDRYIKITKSVRRPRMLSTTRSVQICCTVWAIALAGFIVVVAPSFFKTKDSNSTKCFHYRSKQNAEKTEAILNYITVLIFWIVFFLLILSYVKIAKNLLKISRRRANFPNAGKYTKTARNSFIVLIIFTICFVPYHMFRVVYITSQLLSPSCYWMQIIHTCNEVMLIFSSFNSCLDPVMYFLMSRSVRKTVFQLICRKLHGEKSLNLESTSDIKLGQYAQERLSSTTPHSSYSRKKSVI